VYGLAEYKCKPSRLLELREGQTAPGILEEPGLVLFAAHSGRALSDVTVTYRLIWRACSV
jgi:hypothetical protein